MKRSENGVNEKKYYRVILPSDIQIEKEDVFYRDKYNDIMNYFKALLTSDEYSEIQQYVQPKGLILLNIHPSTDILDFLRLISKNYFLDLIELDYFEILKSPLKFLNRFDRIFQNIVDETKHKDELQNDSKTYADSYEKIKPNRLILINQSELPENLFNEQNLLNVFLAYHKSYNPEYIKNGIILVWLNESLDGINLNFVYKIFDLLIKVPHLSIAEKEVFLRSYSEKNPRIVFDINTVISYTKDWEILDIRNLLKLAIFKQFLNFELNKTSNEITDIIINLIDSGELKPTTCCNNQLGPDKDLSRESIVMKKSFKNKDMNLNELQSIMNDIQTQPISEFMLSQLYENAAFKNYTELVIIIDKLNKNEVLEENERRLLANYPFILNDPPNRAQIYLEKAKKKVDHIRQSFSV